MQNASHLSTNSPKGASAYAADRGYKGDMCVPVHVEKNSENQRDCTTPNFQPEEVPCRPVAKAVAERARDETFIGDDCGS